MVTIWIYIVWREQSGLGSRFGDNWSRWIHGRRCGSLHSTSTSGKCHIFKNWIDFIYLTMSIFSRQVCVHELYLVDAYVNTKQTWQTTLCLLNCPNVTMAWKIRPRVCDSADQFYPFLLLFFNSLNRGGRVTRGNVLGHPSLAHYYIIYEKKRFLFGKKGKGTRAIEM